MKRIVFLCMFFPVWAIAQDYYDLKRCIQTGLERNYEIRIARNEQAIAENNNAPGNAGYLPVISLSSDYSGIWNNWQEQTLMGNGAISTSHNKLNQTLGAGVYVDWTLFDGLKIQTNHRRLKELQQLGELNTRLTIENYVADISTEYYNYVQQIIRLNNLRSTLELSKERLRIVEEHYHIGSMSRLEWQQAKVDFNADSSKLVKQKELLFSSRIRLNMLMGLDEVEQPLLISDTLIQTERTFSNREDLWQETLSKNSFLLASEKQVLLSELDLKNVQSLNYPYLKLNGGYGYAYNHNQAGSFSRQHTLGLNYGVTLGITLFDGMNRSRQQRNAKIMIENQKLAYDQILLSLKSDFANMMMAYQNNLELMRLEEENLETAEANYIIAMEQYKLGTLSGIELREAQNSLLEAEERLVDAQYSIKLCEISLLQISGRGLEIQ